VYYLQLIDQVRKFKGMTPPESPSEPRTIQIGKFSGWADVKPHYLHYKGNTMHRDHRGRYDQYYRNTTGRNDITGAKVARDGRNLYFYVETAGKLSPQTDRNWMMLFIDTDRDKSTGWNGYDFIVNRVSPAKGKAVVEKNVGNRWEWEKVADTRFAPWITCWSGNCPFGIGLGKQVDMELSGHNLRKTQYHGLLCEWLYSQRTFNFVYSEP